MVFISKFGSVGICMLVSLLCGGYVVLFHLVFLFIVVLGGVGGVFCM